MSYCSATRKSEKGITVLFCNLAEGHETAHPLHFDKKLSVVWREVSNVPAALPATRTTPPRRLKAAAFTTSQFEVVA